MLVTFNPNNKGIITQWFGGSPTSNPTQYTSRDQLGHSGIDSQVGWDTPVPCDNDGYVYKIIRSYQSVENWQGAYMICMYDDIHGVEICQGHFNEILVNQGQYISKGTIWGTEGNKGYVFSGGIQITPAMQKKGDQRGHHVHTAYRPVQREKVKSRNQYYLTNVDGRAYKDTDGYYYRIVFKDNGYKGCVNPMQYNNGGDLSLISKMLQSISDAFKRIAK